MSTKQHHDPRRATRFASALAAILALGFGAITLPAQPVEGRAGAGVVEQPAPPVSESPAELAAEALRGLIEHLETIQQQRDAAIAARDQLAILREQDRQLLDAANDRVADLERAIADLQREIERLKAQQPGPVDPPPVDPGAIEATVGRPVHVRLPDDRLQGEPHLTDWTWDFGDGSPTMMGFNGAHVYGSPGNYTITLNGATFARVRVSADARPVVRVDTMSQLRQAAAVPGRIIQLPAALAMDGKLVVAQDVELRGVPESLTSIDYTGPPGPIFEAAPGVTLRALSIFSPSPSFGKTGVLGIKGADDLSVIDCEIRGIDDLVNGNHKPRRVYISGCRTASDTALRAYLAWVEGEQWVIVGNSAHNSTREHIVRVSASGPNDPGASFVLVANNDFANINRQAAPQSPDAVDIAKSTLIFQSGRYGWAQGNRFRGEVGVGPLSKDGLEAKHHRAKWIVYNGNRHDDRVIVDHGSEHVRIEGGDVSPSIATISNGAAAIRVAAPSDLFGRDVRDLTISRITIRCPYKNVPLLRVWGDVSERLVLNEISWDIQGLSWAGSSEVPLIFDGGWEPHYRATRIQLPPPAGVWPDPRSVARLADKNTVSGYVTAAEWMSATSEQVAPPPPPPTQLAAQVRTNAVAWLTIGGSSASADDLGVGYPTLFGPGGDGWQGYVNRVAKPAVEAMRAAGYKPRLVVHNPFGALPGKRMAFDQLLAARGHRTRPELARGFVEAWQPFLRDNPDVEVIGYLGAIPGDPDFDPAHASADKIQWRLWASAQPILASGMSLALDASAGAESDSVTAAYARLVRASGVEVWIEARPTQEHWAGWPVISEARYFRRSDPERHPDAKALGNLPNDQLGRTMIIIGWHTPAERKQLALEHAAEGRDVALAVPLPELRDTLAAMAVANQQPRDEADAEAEERDPRKEVVVDDPYQQDAAWVRAAVAGDAAAFGELVNRYGEQALRVARRRLRNPEDARDVVQEAWLKCWSQLETLDDPACFGRWLMQSVARLALNQRRANAARFRAAVNPDADPDDSALQRDPSARLVSVELAHVLREVLTPVPQMQREAVVLRFGLESGEPMTWAEIGARRGITKATACINGGHAIRRLRDPPARSRLEPFFAA